MVALCFTAPGSLPARALHQEQALCRAPKVFQPFLPSHCTKQEVLRSGCLQPKSTQLENLWTVMRMLSGFNQSLGPIIRKPVIVDVQDVRPDSILFSFGIAEQCTRHEKILQFLVPRCNKPLEEGIGISVLSDLMGLDNFSVDMDQRLFLPANDDPGLYEIGEYNNQPSLIYPKSTCHSQKPCLDLLGDMDHNSIIAAHPNRWFFTPSTGMMDLLSIISEFYLPKNSAKFSKQPLLVPQFTRLDGSEAQAFTNASSVKLQTTTVSPIKSPDKIKLRPLPRKKHARKTSKERDLHRKNQFHACESLLSMILYRRRGKMVMLSLKNSSQEMPEFLTQLSVGIAGTGLAVILSVLGKIAGGRIPLCANKLLNTGLGFGLVWLSWAVNGLRDTIVAVSKNSSRLETKEEEILGKVNKSLNQVFFRAATLMAVVVLRFV